MALRRGITRSRAELQVDAPDVVGLTVQQGRVSAVERRVEPEPALGRVVRLHHHVGDQEAVLEGAALELQAQGTADRAARAVGREQVVAGQVVGAVRGLHRQAGAVAARLDAGDPVLPADLRAAQLRGARDQPFLGIVLLQVHEGGPVVARLGQQVELVDLAVAEEHPAPVPGDPLVAHPLGDAQAVADLERALGEADRPAAEAHGVVVVQNQGRNAAACQIDRGGQADQPGADDYHRVVRLRSILVRRAAIGIARVLVALGHGAA
jgi:hypothetical protein